MLAIDALVLAMPRGDGMTGLRSESEYNLVATPVLLGWNQRVALIGDDGARVEVGIRPAWRLQPGGEVDRNLVFTVPQGARLTRLHLAVATRTAEWNL